MMYMVKHAVCCAAIKPVGHCSSQILLYALCQTIPWIIFVNLLVLIAINRIWGSYIAIIVSKLHRLAHKVAIMDLRSQLHDTEYEVLR